MATSDKDPRAPFGYDDKGDALAPYGLKMDGTPKTSRRGAAPGAFGNGKPSNPAAAKKTTGNMTDARRKSMLIDLSQQLIEVPLVALSSAPPLRAKFGKHAEALAGDAVIVHAYAPSLVDVVILAAQTKPKLLAWMDAAETKAPFIMLTQTLLGIGKTMVSHHANPDPALNAAGQTLVQITAKQMIEAMEREAREMGISTEQLAQAA